MKLAVKLIDLSVGVMNRTNFGFVYFSIALFLLFALIALVGVFIGILIG